MQQFVLDVMELTQLKETQHKHVLANQQHGIMQELAKVNQKFTLNCFSSSFYLFINIKILF